MKISPKYIFLFLFCFQFSFNASLAHNTDEEEHRHSSRTWKSNEHQVLSKGSFLFSKDDKVYIEQEDGKVISFHIDQLSWMDKDYVKSKSDQIQALNIPLMLYNPSPTPFDWTQFGQLLVFTGMFCGVLYFLIQQYKLNDDRYLRMRLASFAIVSTMSFVFACKKGAEAVADAVTDPAFVESCFAAFKPSVSTRWDDNYYYVESNGIPSHNMMVGITSWQQQVPITQNYTGSNAWSIPLKPVFADQPISTSNNLYKGAVAIAANGIPIFNALNNRGDDTYKVGELDNWGGHCGKADDYHYHLPPLHLESTNGLKPIAFALDGYAVYGSKEPDGSAVQALDTYHGHVYNNLYHYHGNTTFPYMIAAMRGKITLDPNTTAPENQIIPQSSSSSPRPPFTPLTGATITNFKSTGTNAYSLEYEISGKKGYVNYSWDNAGNYTFVYIDTNGGTTTTVYKK